MLGLKGAGHEELAEVTAIFKAQMERLGHGMSHTLLLTSFMALYEQGLCRAFKFRDELLALAKSTGNHSSDLWECLIVLGDERSVLSLLLAGSPEQENPRFFEENFDVFVRLREAQPALSHLQGHFPESRILSDLAKFLKTITGVMDEVRKLETSKDRPFPRTIWEPMQRLENSNRLPLCPDNHRKLLNGCALVTQNPAGRREDRIRLKSIFSGMRILR